MRASKRPDCPDWLNENWEAWGREYACRLAENSQYRFQWKQFEGERVNRRLMPLLQQMTDEHCAYCDWYPTDVGTDRTIDHFRPKAQFPVEAYHWPNLYLCCRTCQEKDDHSFSDDLLRPDEAEFSFDRFFIYNYRNGELQSNPEASNDDQCRADLTITHFKLNEGGRPAARKRALEQFRHMDLEFRRDNLASMPFRFLLLHELAD